MIDSKILNYVNGKLRYVFDLGGYLIPSELNGFNYIADRKRELTGHTSSYVKKFEEDIKRLGGQKQQYQESWYYIREFPIPIEEVDFYNKCLDLCNVKKDSAFRNYKHFKLDFLFPYLGLIVEIDSNYHNDRLEYDKARDIYMKNIYGLDIIRLYEYGKSQKERPKLLKKVIDFVDAKKKKWKISNQVPTKTIIEFSKSIINEFKRQESGYFELIEKVRNKLGDDWYIIDTIDISMKEFNTDYPLDDKIFQMNLREILLYVFKKTCSIVK